jgi:acyl-CoA thioesterase
LAAADAGARPLAQAKETNATRKTALYEAQVWQADGKKIASGQALAYRKGKPLPLSPQGDLI